MTDTGEKIVEAINVQTVFTVGNVAIKESVVTMWIVSGFLIAMMIFFTRNMSVENPKGRQLILEWAFVKFERFFRGLLGKNGRKYASYMLFVFLFLTFMNAFPVFGFKPPAKDINVTLTFAVITIVIVEVAGIKQRGFRKWAKGFTEPIAVVTPMNFLEIIIRPFSLCMRLMGNMLGGYTIMKLIEIVVPMVIPAIASLYFDFFDGILQAFVFAFLSSLYIGEAVED